MSSGQAGNAGPDYNKIEMLTGILAHEQTCEFAIAGFVGNFKRSGVLSPQAGA
jgi:hypothetical protein